MQEKEVGASIKERTISPTDKVVSFQTTLVKQQNRKKDYSLGFVFPGNWVEIHKEIKQIFNEEMEKSCKTSPVFFSACFQNCAFGALFRKGKKVWSNNLQNKTLINKAAVFTLQGLINYI